MDDGMEANRPVGNVQDAITMKLFPHFKDFQGQHKPKKAQPRLERPDPVIVSAATLPGFVQNLFELVKHKIGPMARVVTAEPLTFETQPALYAAQLSDSPFLFVFEKVGNNRKYSLSAPADARQGNLTEKTLNESILRSWAKADMDLFILRHGDLRTLSDFNTFAGQVLSRTEREDRATAPAMETLLEIIGELKIKHPHLEAKRQSAWGMWANNISKLPVPQQAAAIEADPPNELKSLFHQTPQAADRQNSQF
ncbi:hypothetical protein DFJ73DRAFT_967643 [Zopfochytrium polystomum]|nr:hypothetical protein DFJ73DRAFT_967643 [Zopfochytrium polystomum]